METVMNKEEITKGDLGMWKKTGNIVMLVMVCMIAVVLCKPALGHQIQLGECFMPGIEVQPGWHAVLGLALSPDEETLYVAHWTDTASDPIGIYSPASCSLDNQLVIGRCVGDVVVSADGRYVLGTKYYGGEVYRFDMTDTNTPDIIDLGSWANKIWKTPDSNRAIVSYNNASGNPTNHTYLALIDISGGDFSVLDTIDVGRPVPDFSAGFSSDSSLMYVAVGSSTTEGAGVAEVSMAGDQLAITRTSEVLGGAANVIHSLTGVVLVGENLYVADKDDMKIHIVDISTFTKTEEISLPYGPSNIGLHPNGRCLFVLYPTEGIVSALELQSNTQIGSVAGLRAGLHDIEFAKDGSKAYVSHYDIVDGGVSVLLLSETYYVDAGDGNDSNYGLTPETAFETIQHGIDTAWDGDTVLVLPGTYAEELDALGKAITVASYDEPAVITAPDGYGILFVSGEDADTVFENFIISGSDTAIGLIGSSPTINHFTVVDNDLGAIADEFAYPTIENSIFWNNVFGDLLGCDAIDSFVEDDANGLLPLFADANNGDYRLKSERGRYWPEHDIWVLDDVTSPCVDAGDPNIQPAGERMPNGGRINQGAYGNTSQASMSEWPLKHDSSRNGMVNFVDFAQMADEWLDYLPWVYNESPEVSITYPEQGETVPYNTIDPVIIEVDASDSDGSVVKVEFFANGDKVAEDTSGYDGWQGPWHPVSDGDFTLTARAMDDEGASATSEAIDITIGYVY